MRAPVAVATGLATVAALSGAFAVGTAVGGDAPVVVSRAPGPPTGDDAVVAAFHGTDLEPAGDCADLLAWYVERGVDEVGPWGWGGGPIAYAEDGIASDAAGSSAAGDRAPLAASPQTVRQTNEATGTNVQEAGVDEPDGVKTDGATLFRVDGDGLTTYDVSGAEVRRLGSVDLPRMRGAEILLAGDTVVAIAQDEDGRSTRIAVLDVSDPAEPVVEQTLDYDTALVTARLVGDTVRLVLQRGLPDLAFVEPGSGWLFGRGEAAAERRNEEIVRASTIDDWLPHVAVDGGDPAPLLGCSDVGLPDDEAGLGTIAVVGFGADSPTDASVTGLAVDTDIAYASPERLYLATSPATAGWSECFETCSPVLQRSTTAYDGRSRLYSFALAGRATTYVASAEVDGLVRDRWSLDEADGVLRVALGSSSATGDANAIATFREEGDDLVETGRVHELGPGEDIQAVRWFDHLAILVTFRQTDPLYAVDLTDPSAPRLLGALKIPGFSAYLHPLGADRMIGVGEGPADGTGGSWGAQVGLFDVTDLTAPRRIALTHYGADTYALAGGDPRQLTWLPERRTVLTVVEDYARGTTTGYVSILRLGDGAMSNEMVQVEQGDEVSAVRLVPLPDGRVVLATGDGASFLDLDA